MRYYREMLLVAIIINTFVSIRLLFVLNPSKLLLVLCLAFSSLCYFLIFVAVVSSGK